MKFFLPGIAAAFVLTATSLATGSSETSGKNKHTPYAGQQTRAVSTLSSSDIEALRAGGGWGLAKPAEFNGYPGPRHILDLAGELSLSGDQIAAISKIFDAMNARARAAGPRLIDAEKALDAAFKSAEITPRRLRELVGDAEAARGELRIIHLEAHLQATPLLTRHQRHLYAQLRGYGGAGSHGAQDHHKH